MEKLRDKYYGEGTNDKLYDLINRIYVARSKKEFIYLYREDRLVGSINFSNLNVDKIRVDRFNRVELIIQCNGLAIICDKVE